MEFDSCVNTKSTNIWLEGRIEALNTSLINHGEIIDIFCQLIFCEVIYDWFWTVLRTKYDDDVATKIGFLFVGLLCHYEWFSQFSSHFRGTMHCLPRRLKSTFFKIISNGAAQKGPAEWRKNFKKCWF